jgi:uncharacterized Fe-S cluster protein YjdI
VVPGPAVWTTFQPMRIHNPVLECIFAHANVMIQDKLVFDLKRPPAWIHPSTVPTRQG